MSRKSVHIRLDENDYVKLTSLANQLGCAKASVVRMILRAHPKQVAPWNEQMSSRECVGGQS